MTQPGIPNEYSLSTSCYGDRLQTIEDQAFATVAMGFRRMELGLAEEPVPLNGFHDSRYAAAAKDAVAALRLSRTNMTTGETAPLNPNQRFIARGSGTGYAKF